MDARSSDKPKEGGWRIRHLVAVFGPGILAMLADTDAGSIATAAQSGAQWGDKLLFLQVVLIPVLYVVQELTARLGILTGKGHAELIRQHYGAIWAWISTSTLLLACLGALLTEFGGIAAVGSLLHMPVWLSLLIAVAGLIAMALTGSYRSVQRIALGVGAFEVAFVAVAVLAHPSWTQIVQDTAHIPFGNSKFLVLVSANIGAVIMPWMIFYQQGSVIDKGLKPSDLPLARIDTALGAVITQIVMASILVASAAALSHGKGGKSLDDVGQVASALSDVLGPLAGRLCFGFGVLGASVVATIVVTLTAARTLGELTGYSHSLDRSPREAPIFYGVYAVVLILAAGVVAAGVNIVSLSVGVQVMNAMLLPIVLGFLFLLARKLPAPHRLAGAYAWIVGILMLVTTLLGLYAGVTGNAR